MSETTVTGRPIADYEKYVELLANAMANGLALATEREFLTELDPSVPLHEAMRPHARSAIWYRFASDIDEIESVVARTTSPDAATEREVAWGKRRHEDAIELANRLDKAMDERDAALAAIERVRALHYEEDHECAECSFEPMLDAGFRGVSVPWPCPTVAALDEAPEPEYEWGAALVADPSEATAHADKETALKNIKGWNESSARIKRMGRHTSGPAMLVRRRKAGPWEPVGGENFG